MRRSRRGYHRAPYVLPGSLSVAGLHRVGMATVWQHPQAAAEDQRIVDITWIIENSAIDGGDAHFIAVIAYPAHYSAGDATRREYALRQIIHRRIQRAKAEYIGTGDGVCRDAQYIT